MSDKTTFDYFTVAKAILDKAKGAPPQRFSLQEKGAEQTVVEHIMQQCKELGVSHDAVLKKLPQEMQALRQAPTPPQADAGKFPTPYSPAEQAYTPWAGPSNANPVNFRGDPVSAEQAKPEPGLEDVMMPHEYLEGAAGLAGLADTQAVKHLPDAIKAAKAAWENPEALGDTFRQMAEAGRGSMEDAEKLAKAAKDASSVWGRAKDAFKSFTEYEHGSREEARAAADTIKRMRSKAVKAVTEDTPPPADYVSAKSSDKTLQLTPKDTPK